MPDVAIMQCSYQPWPLEAPPSPVGISIRHSKHIQKRAADFGVLGLY